MRSRSPQSFDPNTAFDERRLSFSERINIITCTQLLISYREAKYPWFFFSGVHVLA